MVQILRDGEQELKTKIFKCDKCGCIFTTTTYSKDFSNLESIENIYHSNCPQCLSQSHEVFLEEC